MDPSIDVASALALASALTLALAAYAITSVAAGHPLVAARVEREVALPLVGRAPMHAVYRPLVPLARALVVRVVSANTVSVSALALAAAAAVAFATGHFGLGAAIACVASLADGLDGLVARLSGTKSRFGQVLDTMIDRYVDALFLGGIAVHVRHEAGLLALTIAALVGSFMVSYASSVERELNVTFAGGPSAMRRVHRLAYIITAAAAGPLLARAFDEPRVELVPLLLAVGAIAVIGNVSSVRRLLGAARIATARDAAPTSGPEIEVAPHIAGGGAPR